MKTLKLILASTTFLVCLMAFNFSCKKDKPKPPPDIYIGSFQLDMDPTTYPLKFALNSDGTLTAYNNPADLTLATGSGTYKINNNTFTADVTYPAEPGIHYLFSAQYGVTEIVNGVWGTAPSNSNGGSWSMTKQ